jgi:hypothetical protein
MHPILSSYWHAGKSRSLSGKIDAWDIPLAASMRFQERFTVLSPVNLVTNVGSDNYSAHTKTMEWPLGIARSRLPKDWASRSVPELVDGTKFFENEIYKIRFRNILSKPAAMIFDSIRFRVQREPMQIKVDNHQSKFLHYGKPQK